MKKSTGILLAVFTLMALSSYAFLKPGEGDKPKYVGSTACKMCHNAEKVGKQYAKWEATPHAKAFKVLQTPEADKVAADRGSKTKAAETPECLGCHVSGQSVAGAEFDAKYSKEEGVSCEACHGAGAGYKTLHMKKENLDKAKAAGMLLPNIADGSAEKLCVTCHNEKSPTYKKFDIKEYWAKIAHPLPKG
jgi:hypothetical protein